MALKKLKKHRGCISLKSILYAIMYLLVKVQPNLMSWSQMITYLLVKVQPNLMSWSQMDSIAFRKLAFCILFLCLSWKQFYPLSFRQVSTTLLGLHLYVEFKIKMYSNSLLESDIFLSCICFTSEICSFLFKILCGAI